MENVGTISINLAEYIGMAPKMRRYLLESKFNSTIRLTIDMTSCQSDSAFKRAPLNDAQIFSDVTEAIIGQSSSSAPSNATTSAKDTGTFTRHGTSMSMASISSVGSGSTAAPAEEAPKITVKSGHMSLRRAINHHERSLKEGNGADVEMLREGGDEESAQDIVDRILASGGLL